MRRGVFNIGELQGSRAEWVRLRDNGNVITMTYKVRNSVEIDAAKEYEVEVNNFDNAYELLSKLKWNGVFYQENRRQIFLIDDIEFMIDTRPMIPTYLEVESSSKDKVEKGMNLLGFAFEDGENITGSMVYEKYGIDIHQYKELKF
ncbi:MAG: CYTH domain-containing protein [bacterium]|nr:CYTH domain-containing protein [bacterium]